MNEKKPHASGGSCCNNDKTNHDNKEKKDCNKK